LLVDLLDLRQTLDHSEAICRSGVNSRRAAEVSLALQTFTVVHRQVPAMPGVLRDAGAERRLRITAGPDQRVRVDWRHLLTGPPMRQRLLLRTQPLEVPVVHLRELSSHAIATKSLRQRNDPLA
jgi:hypothetical protein